MRTTQARPSGCRAQPQLPIAEYRIVKIAQAVHRPNRLASHLGDSAPFPSFQILPIGRRRSLSLGPLQITRALDLAGLPKLTSWPQLSPLSSPDMEAEIPMMGWIMRPGPHSGSSRRPNRQVWRVSGSSTRSTARALVWSSVHLLIFAGQFQPGSAVAEVHKDVGCPRVPLAESEAGSVDEHKTSAITQCP